KKEIEVDIYTRKYCGSYSKEMSNVLNEVHKQRYDLVLELHFNAFNDVAEGVETLCYYKNEKTKLLSEKLIKYHYEMLNLKKRKLIEIKDMTHNGAYGIMKCKYPYILTESFFGDNRSDCLKIESAKNLAKVFIEFLKSI
ncbi:MAG: N-acetylmuramoyl-L-alanine amidase, partial [Fusobacteriaceae bacterium]